MNSSKNLLLTIILVALSLLFKSTSWAGVPLTVTLNKSVLINLKNPARYITIADKDMVDVPDPLKRSQLLVNGRKIGSTNMIVWEEGVEKPTFFDINVVGDQNAIETQIREHSGANDRIHVEYARDTVILSGTVVNIITAKKAEEIAKAYSTKVLNQITIDTPQQVLLQVKVAQVDKSSLKKLGISAIVKGGKAEGFSNLVGAPSGSTTVSSTGTNVVTNGLRGIAGLGPGIGSFDPLDPFSIGVSYFPAGVGAVLQALSSKGLAKILAEPNLLVKSGEEGNFLAGSKIPYNVLISTGGAATSSIVFETVGIKVKFKPEVLENGLINLKIDPAEVSSIAGALSVNGYPIIDTRDVRTSVELRDGESLVLAGLLQEEQIKNMQKIPILGDIPILGALFRATQDEIREKELVFFITPKLIQPNPPGSEPELPTDRDTDQEEKELNWMPLGE